MLKHLKFDYTVIISLLGKGEWYELFLQQEESENYRSRCRDNRVSYFRAKVYGLVVQVTHPLSLYIVYNSSKKQKNPA